MNIEDTRRELVKKPDWLKVRLTTGENFTTVNEALEAGGLATVCKSARCPNRAECWSAKTATFLLLGENCTRGCGFCAVKRATSGETVEGEAARVVEAVKSLSIDYVVLTSVTRDDLLDGGVSTYAETIALIKALPSSPLVEVLTPDYTGDALETLLKAKPEVFAHNIEVVERLSPTLRHHRFDYRRSLAVLREAKELAPKIPTKSSIMVGVGETLDEVREAMEELRGADVDILVIGQYLRPTLANTPVKSYIEPIEFDQLAREGEAMGFSYVAATPLARTSYKAKEAYASYLSRCKT